ncbi:MAG: response regulator [Myxococcales bacterium]|nr:response regulator [Myxococcales bacterium]MDP3506183.1 response regulator [Myxococcales bacterium]
MLQQLSALVYPVESPGEEERTRAELLIIGSLVVASGAVLMRVMVAAGLFSRAPVAVPAFLCCASCLVALRLTRSLDAASMVLSASLTITCAVAGWLFRDLTLLGWLGLVPIAALLHSSARQATVWMVIDLVCILVIGGLLARQPEPLFWAPAGQLVMRLAIATVLAFSLTVSFAIGRRRAEQALLQARDEARAANAMKSAFLASFSHEIRTPLNGVLGTADGLLASPLPAPVREQLLIIQRSGSSLLRTINDVLELSRIESGRVELFPVATDLQALLSEVVDLFRARATAAGLELTLELAPGHPRHVVVDDLRLRQVVQNLVSNAVKFTQRGYVRVTLEGQRDTDGLKVTRITVSDSGPGIAPDAAARLFSVFTQARPKTDRADGSGLGLALSRNFVELMGGTLELQTNPGHGSTFTVSLRLPPAKPAEPTPMTPPLAFRLPLKVLVVDDNEINLKVATSLVARLGHQTVTARDGAQALEVIKAEQPDVVLMDCQMPVMDGFEATRALRSAGDLRPVIAVTASVYGEDQAHCREAGMNHFVSKPVSLRTLEAALRDVKPQARPAANGGKRRVLVVDDDPYVRRATVRMLRAEGYEVDDAADVEAALILFERTTPHHVLIDFVLGGEEDGLHFARRLLQGHAGLGVVVTSGAVPTGQQLAQLTADGGRFLSKPYTGATLARALEERPGPGLERPTG